MRQNYSQLTVDERNQFYALQQAEMPMTEIANQLGRSRTTLYNELNRNRGGRGYRPHQAQQFAEKRRAEKVQPLKMRPEVIAYLESKLQLQWSPEQIASMMKTDPDGSGLAVSPETIYRYVWEDKRAGGTLYTHLRHGLKKRRKRQAARIYAGRSTIAWTSINAQQWSKPASGSAIGKPIWSAEPGRRVTW